MAKAPGMRKIGLLAEQTLISPGAEASALTHLLTNWDTIGSFPRKQRKPPLI